MARRAKNYWTKERCIKESLKYSSRREFYKKSGSAYSSSRKNGWLNEICKHMNTPVRRASGYWTKALCHKEAQKYKSRIDFYKKSPAAYSAAHKKTL